MTHEQLNERGIYIYRRRKRDRYSKRERGRHIDRDKKGKE
jgi:hypothetical protein